VLFISSGLASENWPFFHKILTHLASEQQQFGDDEKSGEEWWTVVANEQTYVVVENLRALVASVSSEKAFLIGRRIFIRFFIFSIKIFWKN
jgi:hypothetical protein